MDRKDGKIHYHIRWAHIPLLDYEPLNTRVEAEAAAQRLAGPGETYSIEEHGEGCQRCRDAAKAKNAEILVKSVGGPLRTGTA
jgi:hypothetical protein